LKYGKKHGILLGKAEHRRITDIFDVYSSGKITFNQLNSAGFAAVQKSND